MSASGGSVGSRVKSMPGLNPGFAPATPSRNSSCGKRKPAGSRRPLARCHAINVRSAALLRASGPAAQWLTSPDHPPELAEERAMMPLDLFTDDPRWAAWRTELRGDKAALSRSYGATGTVPLRFRFAKHELNGDRDVDLSAGACRPGRDCHAFCRV